MTDRAGRAKRLDLGMLANRWWCAPDDRGKRLVVLVQSCVARLQPAEEEAADEPAVVEKVEACQ
jgi:hypothetical protein